MAKAPFQGNISLVGFGVLEPSELDVVNKIIAAYFKQLDEKTDCKSLKLILAQRNKGKSMLHEITAHAQIGNDRIRSTVTEWNLYKGLGELLENIVTEAIHKHRLAKEIGEERIRKEQKQARKTKRL